MYVLDCVHSVSSNHFSIVGQLKKLLKKYNNEEPEHQRISFHRVGNYFYSKPLSITCFQHLILLYFVSLNFLLAEILNSVYCKLTYEWSN